jgi:signal transduction histidine kinase
MSSEIQQQPVSAAVLSAQQLGRRYVVALALIALLTIVSQAVVQFLIADQAHDSRVVNIAGRQRMLSQRISKLGHYILNAPSVEAASAYRRELDESLSLWKRSHAGLLRGDSEMGLPGKNSNEVITLFGTIQAHHEAMLAAGRAILSPTADAVALSRNIQVITEHESAFLKGMNDIVFLYDSEAKAKVNFAKWLEVGLLVITLAVLMIEAIFIFSPAVRRIRTDTRLLAESEARLKAANDALEARVRKRTVQLEDANARLEASARDLTRSNEELERFAHVASHDLQEPVRAVVGFVQLLEKRIADRLDGEGREFMNRAIRSALHMRTMIHGILAYSRVGAEIETPQRLDSGQALLDALALLEKQISDAGADVQASPLPEVSIGRAQLVQLFENLIGNAIKFRTEAAPRVSVDARRDGAQWRFTITDNGIGIDEEFRERIFVMFQRLHTLDEYEGTGIGLAICKRIVQHHGGEIGIEPAPGGGSAFWFTLPDKTGD